MTAPTPEELLSAALDFVRAESLGFDITDPEVQRTVVDAHKRNQEKAQALAATRLEFQKRLAASRQPTESVVYYMRVGNRVKIGYTTNMKFRLAAVMPEELLATEPGGAMLEDVRHRQFADLRTSREWFKLEGRLAEHITKLQEAAA